MTESFLQYVWRYGLLQGDLTTTEGQPVRILRAGDWNRDAGPDFTDARVMIGPTMWAGNIEMHLKSSDWKQHGHSTDKKYNNVVLHVVWTHDCEIVTENGNRPATVAIAGNVAEELLRQYEQLVLCGKENEIRCAEHLKEMDSWRMKAFMDRLAIERMERKSGEVRRLLADARGSWETCCYWLLARFFGGKTNAFAFELLAKCTDMRLLARWKDNPQRIEALLMGQAGMLEGMLYDEYPRQLQADYEALRRGANLSPMDGYLWKTFRLRPSSFPTLRISQLAQLISRSSNLFQYLLEQTDAKEIARLFELEASPYWDNHYQFDVEAKPMKKRLGKDFANLLVINAWVPLLVEYGNQHGDADCRERALGLLQQVEAEDNVILRRWSANGVKAKSALDSQALIELNNEYCKKQRCLECQVGYRIMKSSNAGLEK